MLGSGLGIFSGALNGLDEGVKEIPEGTEAKEINNTEGVEYSEEDLERVEIASDLMQEIFADEVISNWENFTVDERMEYLNEYYTSLGEALGANTEEIYVADLYEQCGYGVVGVSHGNGIIGVDIRTVEDPSQLGELLDTVVHETRHQLQRDAIENPDAFPGISPETLEQWGYESGDNYVNPNYDPEGYAAQAVETDARAFAEEVMNDYMSNADDVPYSVADQAAEVLEDIVPDSGQVADGAGFMSAETDIDPDSFDPVEESADSPDTEAEIGQVNGIEVEENLNQNTFSYTAGQCARVSTGTQNYCIFSGSGR